MDDSTEYVVTILLKARSWIEGVVQKAARSVDGLRKSEEKANKASEEHTRSTKRQGDALSQLTEAHVREKVALDDSTSSLEDRIQASRHAEAQYRDEAERLRELARDRIREVGSIDDEARALERRARSQTRLANEQQRTTAILDEQAQSSSRFPLILGRIGDGADAADVRLNRLNASLQGFQIAFAIKYAQALISGLVSLAGVLFSVAAAAATAGATLAGTFTTGLAQAAPVLGLIVAGAARLIAVMKAVTLTNQQALTATHDNRAAMERQRNAANQVTAAQERVAEAHRRVEEAQEGVEQANDRLTQAQEGLTRARSEAKDEIEDLIAAEKRARIEAEESSLAFEGAQRALQDAIAAGDVAGAAGARVDLEAAGQTRTDARRDARRARRDATQAETAGVELSERVVSARRQVEAAEQGVEEARERVADATRDVSRAERALAEANHDAAAAMDQQTAAADRLNAMLAQLSPAERRLYQMILRIQDTFREHWRPITDIITSSITRALGRTERLLRDSRIVGAFRGLARSMARANDEMSRELTNDRWRSFYVSMTREASRNVPLVNRILMTLARTLRNIAEAAAPAFRLLLRMIEGYADRAERASSSTGRMERFFRSGVRYIRSFVELGLAAVKLFAALAGAGGAIEGKRAIDGVTSSLNRATRWVNSHRAEVRKFFADAREGAGHIIGVLIAIGHEMVRVFRPGQLEAFGQFLTQVVIPALGNTIQIMGILTSVFHRLLSLPIVRDVAQYAATILILTKAFLILRGAVVAIIGLARAFLAFNPYVAIFIALATAVVMLDRRFHFLRPTLEWLERTWKKVFNSLRKPVSDLVKWVKRNWEGLAVVLGGPFAIPIVAIIKNFDRLKQAARAAIEFIVDAFRGGGGDLARVFRVLTAPARIMFAVFMTGFRNMIRIFQGVVEIITHIARGEWGEAWGALKDTVSDVVRNIGRLVGRIARLVWNALGDVISLLPRFGRLLLRAATLPFRLLVRGIWALLRRLPGLVRSAFDGVFGFMRRLPGRLGNLAKDAASALVDAFKDVGGRILKGIVGGVKGAAGFGRDLINGIIDLLNDALPNKISVPAAPDIDLPDNPIPKLAVGGKVNAPMFMVGEEAPGYPEFVFSTNPRDRSRMVPLLIELLQLYGMRGFQEGGTTSGSRRVPRGDTAQTEAASLPSADQVEDLMKMINKIIEEQSDQSVAIWRRAWRRMFNILDDSGDRQRRALRASLRRMGNDTDDGFGRMQSIARRRSSRLVSGVQGSLRSLMRSVYTGMDYVGDATNVALKAFDADQVKLNVPRPKALREEERAFGGRIGQAGERGRDVVRAWLGRGEVVLNRPLELALNAHMEGQETVDSVIKRYRGQHAGGVERPFSFQRGGRVQIPGTPHMIHRNILGSVVAFIKKYKALITAGWEGGHSAAGEHPIGYAVDAVPGRGGSWDLLGRAARAAGWRPGRPSVPPPFRWIGWNTESNHGAPPRPNAHLHISWLRGRKLNTFPGAGGIIDEVPRIVVEGAAGALRSLSQNAINRVRKAANALLEKRMESSLEGIGGAPFPQGGVASRQQVQEWFTEALKISGNWPTARGRPRDARQALRNLMSLAFEESTWNPNAQNNTAAGRAAGGPKGILQVVGATFRAFAMAGYRNIFNPVHNAIASIRYQIDRWGGINRAHAPYAQGGEVPGAAGRPVPILAHAREWVLNPGHQERLARMLGVTRDRAKELLGIVSRRGRRFQGGGEIPADLADWIAAAQPGEASGPLPDLQDLMPEEIAKIFKSANNVIKSFMRRLNTKSKELDDRIRRSFTELTRENGLLDQIAQQLEQMQAAAAASLQRAQFKISRTGLAIRRGLRPDEIASREETALREQRAVLEEEAQVIARGQRAARAALRRARTLRGEERKKAEDAAQAAINNLAARSRTNAAALAQNAQEIVEKHEQVQQALAERINSEAERQIGVLDLQERIATALGQQLDPNTLAQQRLKIMRDQQDAISDVLADARTSGNRELAATLESQLRDLEGQIAETTGQMFQNSIEAVNNAAARDLAANDLVARMAEIGGTNHVAKQLALEARGGVLARQRAGLVGLMLQAEAEGNIQKFDELAQAVAELDVSIAENTQAVRDNTNAAFAARVEDVNTSFGFISTINSAATSFFQALGTLTGSPDMGALLGLAASQGTALTNQRGALSGLLADLLGYTLEERAGLAGLSGRELVDYVLSITTGPALDSILGRLDPAQEGQFRELTAALIGNAQATIENTQSISELNGQIRPQTFSTSAWQLYRTAIMNGLGGFLPQYAPPQLHNGTHLVTRGGVFELAAGEAVADPMITASMSGGGDVYEGDTNITVEKGEHLDERQLATQMAWERKRRGRDS